MITRKAHGFEFDYWAGDVMILDKDFSVALSDAIKGQPMVDSAGNTAPVPHVVMDEARKFLREMSPTTAQRVSALLDDDGLFRWEDDTGRSLDDVCLAHDGEHEELAGHWNENHQSNAMPERYVFPDGSAIVLSHESWDIEGESDFVPSIRASA